MSLDIDSPKGQQSLIEERKMLDVVRSYYEFDVFETDKEVGCRVDGFLARDNQLFGVFESKCREMDLHTLRVNYKNQWLITYDKILAGLDLSKQLYVPYYGLLYLLHEPICMMIQISDDRGNAIVDIAVRETITQRSINGGLAKRVNGFVDMSTAYTFPAPPEAP